jgi:hypothetical protein
MQNVFFKKKPYRISDCSQRSEFRHVRNDTSECCNSRYDKRPLLAIMRYFRFEKSKPSTSNYRSVNINRYFKTLVVCLAAQNTRKIWRIEYLLCGRYSISERNIVWRFVSIVFFEAFAFAQKTFSVLPLPNV